VTEDGADGGARPGDPAAPLAAARASGLVVAGEPLLAMLSGGPDSVCLLDVAVTLGAEVAALHVDHGLRPDSGADADRCRALCERLGVALTVERLDFAGAGNVHARAREARYALAERHAVGDYAAGHTASDQAETVLYRLASSPGRRALLGMAPRRGRLVRPLLAVTAADTRAHCVARGLAWIDDPANSNARFARARVREALLPALREVDGRAERAIAETAAQLRDEQEVLDDAAAAALDRLGGGPAVDAAALAALGPALARLVLRRLAELAAGGPRPLGRGETAALLELAGAREPVDSGRRGGTRALDLGGGLRAVAEYGTLRFAAGPPPAPPEAVELAVPGRARFGAWEVVARAGGGGEVECGAAALGARATVRAWRAGDRMRPAGLGGSRTLADLFADRKVPRELRPTVPVVEVAGEIAWVAGVAVGERFAAGAGDDRVGLSARRAVAT